MCWRTTTERIYKKRGSKFTDRITWGYDAAMCHRRQRREIRNNAGHPWGISSPGYGRWGTHDFRRDYCRVNHQTRSDRKYIWHSQKGKPMLYVQLKKALYGTLQAALLFWKLLSTTLQEWGFTINRYDQCVANKVINGKQCTIIWHVDDLKISHLDKKVVEDI